MKSEMPWRYPSFYNVDLTISLFGELTSISSIAHEDYSLKLILVVVKAFPIGKV